MTLNDYEVLKAIGRGTYGEVHLVASKKDRKQYVIKKMALVKASAKERKAAEQEAKLLSNLRHPNIVSYKDSFESDSNLYIVMGFAEGGDLYTKLREHRDRKDFLTEQQIVRWYIQICMALQYLHERRILHRDLKTQNIFLTKTKMIKVGDLGIAKVLESSSDMATTLIGTPYYMSPELFSNRPYNHKSDVWALGCCIYEMVTLKHAFNAKDMNSLVYKILKGKMPPMPNEYSDPLCELIKSMLHQTPDKRPSVNRILRNPFIKKHIKLFLDESSRRRPSSSRSSRRTSAASSAAGSDLSSRKSSVNSQASSPSPHPPTSSRDPKGKSPIFGVPSESPSLPHRSNSPAHLPKNDTHITKEKDTRSSPLETKETGFDGAVPGLADSKGNAPAKEASSGLSSSTTLKPTAASVEVQGKLYRDPSSLATEVNTNSNNSCPVDKHVDSGVSVNFVQTPKYQEVSHQDTENQMDATVGSKKNGDPACRVDSASSTCSSSSSASRKNHRLLPRCPAAKTSSEPKRSQQSGGTNKSAYTNLHNSMESVSSVASSVTSTNEDGTPRVSSARQRRRERQLKQRTKTPPIVEEIRKSRNSGIKPSIANRKHQKPNTKSYSEGAPGKMKTRTENEHGAGDSAHSAPRSRENSGSFSTDGLDQPQPEMDEFMTLLSSTLNLGRAEGEDPTASSPPPSGGGLSPVPELSESSESSARVENLQPGHPIARNTPAATPVSMPPPVLPKDVARHNISQGTLHSTQRLMDRIVSLRRDCIRGLGVPLLHRAYEVLDASENEDLLKAGGLTVVAVFGSTVLCFVFNLQEELVMLLGPSRFEQWAGKIWQLKFCEESMFGHCGTITAY